VTGGTLVLNADGSFDYTPNLVTIADSFSYHAFDGTVGSNVVTVALAVNQAPLAVADSYSVNVGATLNVAAPGVLGNDSDPNGSALTAVLVSGVTNGALTLNANGSFVYTPGGTSSDSFTYRANDGTLNGNIVTVSITVNSSAAGTLYFSTAGNGSVAGVGSPYDDADIYSRNGAAFARVFDARAPGANLLPNNADIDGLAYTSPTSFCVSFRDDTSVSTLGTVADDDVVCYSGGVWTVFFDGSAAGLATSRNLDAIDIAGNILYFSLVGDSSVPGIGSPYDDADIYSWNKVSGQFARVFDARSPGANLLPNNADIDGLAFTGPTDFCVSFAANNTNVGGAAGTVQDEDVVCYTGTGWNVLFDGTAAGFTAGDQDIDALDIP
jgi:hypothetical protein